MINIQHYSFLKYNKMKYSFSFLTLLSKVPPKCAQMEEF